MVQNCLKYIVSDARELRNDLLSCCMFTKRKCSRVKNSQLIKKIGWFSIKNSKWNDTITILCFMSNIENQNCILIITAQPWHNQILYPIKKATYRGQQRLQPPTVVTSKTSSNSDWLHKCRPTCIFTNNKILIGYFVKLQTEHLQELKVSAQI